MSFYTQHERTSALLTNLASFLLNQANNVGESRKKLLVNRASGR
ncbi:hypothetical protein NIES4071_77400 [Calothrix sp. NIES-4071]|nr:hypothetical protein NIES4071_77400 [Calothrix sp. NIES-4071]BAZ62013.1 hypothetical protein NIES4105_77340 [Calothrix sp. NIES-4105]